MGGIRATSSRDGFVSLEVETARGDEDFILTPFRAAYWPRRSTLILSDLHLGHVETYHQFGIAVPRAVAAGELTRLSAVIDRMRPERVLILGDLLHSRIAVTDAFVDEVSRWRAAFPGAVHVVPGNHDRALPRVAGAWNMTVLSELHTEDGVEFAHAPCEDPAAFRWCGHLHPAVALGSRADRIRVPCFALTCNICVLPAFSGMAAGTGRGLPAKCRVFAAAETGVFEIPPRAEGVHRRGR